MCVCNFVHPYTLQGKLFVNLFVNCNSYIIMSVLYSFNTTEFLSPRHSPVNVMHLCEETS